jgi:hypothetical protein
MKKLIRTQHANFLGADITAGPFNEQAIELLRRRKDRKRADQAIRAERALKRSKNAY